MKTKPGSQTAFFSFRLLAVPLVFLAGIFLALLATANPPEPDLAASSNAAADGAPHAQAAQGELTFQHDPARRLDENGYRPSGVAPAGPAPEESRAIRGAGDGAWSLLGPPGGDVADAAVSTVDPNIALAGIAPDGSSGGTLYRSGDGGNTWSAVPALAGPSVFDIEFAAGGNAYIGSIDGVWESSDGGLTWIAHNLGIGVNDQVFDVALDPSNPSILW